MTDEDTDLPSCAITNLLPFPTILAERGTRFHQPGPIRGVELPADLGGITFEEM
ncbi:MAG TPA: hypothetical protein PLN09_15660 [Microthrixaceae bacterium]|nr:hypothetical protein [Microthrixaceae bacterium]